MALLQQAPVLAHYLTAETLAPTLLPENIASLITAVSVAARVSLHASALFIEALLETAKIGTSTGLGLTRRALICAVASARALRYVEMGLDWRGRDEDGNKTDDAFLKVLDRYTSLGVYFVHHSLSLVELFTMSGFYLTITTVSTAFSAAQESVQMLDAIFGSNETSRALASIITLLKQEIQHDPAWLYQHEGPLKALTALTKALTAFVCLQSATHRRTVREMGMRVLYDCTIVTEGGVETTSSSGDDGERPKGRERTQSARGDLLAELHDRDHTSPSASMLIGGSGSSNMADDSDAIEHDLTSLMGGGSRSHSRYPSESDQCSDSEDDRLPPEVEQALRQARSRTTSAAPDGMMDFEIEVETTTTRKTTFRAGASGNRNSRGFKRLSGLPVESTSSLDETERTEEEEEEWVEVMSELSSAVASPTPRSPTLPSFPSSENGDADVRSSPPTSGAARSRQETLEHPEEGMQRLQVVLKTMTRKFRKRTVKRSGGPAVGDASFYDPPSPSSSSAQTSRAASPVAPTKVKPRKSLAALLPSPSNSGTSTPMRDRSPSGTIARVLSRGVGSKAKGKRKAEDENGGLEAEFLRKQQQHPDSLAVPSGSVTAVPPRLRRAASVQSMRSFHTLRTTTTTAAPPAHQPPPPPHQEAANFPKQHLVKNLQHFMRYSSAAYGQAFLRILGIGKHDFNFPHTQTHANVHAFAHHVGIKVQDVILSSFTSKSVSYSSKMAPIVNYVAVDHKLEAVVLSCRGSLGLSDILVDLTCDYIELGEDVIKHGTPGDLYTAHSGMFSSAKRLERGTVHETVRDALAQYPGYGLVLCGHSLGGGVASLLAVLWSLPRKDLKAELAAQPIGQSATYPSSNTPFVTSPASGLPPGRPITCFTYGTPCVASPDLGRYSRGLVVTTVHNFDIVPTLSLGLLKDLKNLATDLYSESGTAEEIVGRVVGLHQRRFLAGRRAGSTSSSSAAGAGLEELGTSSDDEAVPRLLGAQDSGEQEVALTSAEMAKGKGSNRALDPSYRDPVLAVTAEVEEERELNDWLWSLIRTIRASNQNAKLYPPGTVYVVESSTVFVSESEESRQSSNGATKTRLSRKEGRRVLLRLVESVEKRFSEPIFGRSIFTDHSPLGYEENCDLLYQAIFG